MGRVATAKTRGAAMPVPRPVRAWTSAQFVRGTMFATYAPTDRFSAAPSTATGGYL